jgi:hypothetical protein
LASSPLPRGAALTRSFVTLTALLTTSPWTFHDAVMPEPRSKVLSLTGPDGAVVYVLNIPETVDFGAVDVPLSLPFTWITGPFPESVGGRIQLNQGAAAVLQPFSEEGRWERLEAALRKKYAHILRTIVPDSVLTLSEAELLGASAGA